MAIYTSYAFVSPISNKWETKGWWRQEPGGCLTLEASTGSHYFYYSEVDSEDIVVKAWKQGGSSWSGEGGKNTAEMCVKESAFHMFSDAEADDCNQSDRYVAFERLRNKGDNDYRLALVSNKAKDEGIPINTLEEAAAAANGLKGQILYRQKIESDPKGIPFRAGIEVMQDDLGLRVTKVYAGLPGDGLLQRGDVITAVGDQLVRTPFDFIFSLQNMGLRFTQKERIANTQLKVLRWFEEEKAWAEGVVPIDLRYYPEFDNRITSKSEVEAAGVSFVDSVAWGFLPQIYCIGKRTKQHLIDDKPSHQLVFSVNYLGRSSVN